MGQFFFKEYVKLRTFRGRVVHIKTPSLGGVGYRYFQEEHNLRLPSDISSDWYV